MLTRPLCSNPAALLVIWLSLGAFWVAVSSPLCHAHEPPEREILIVLPGVPDMPTHELTVKGIKERLSGQSRYRFRYSYEYLNLSRFADEKDYLDKVASFFSQKYANKKPDVVITGITLSQFMADHGKDIFPGVPVIVVWNETVTPTRDLPDGFHAVSGKIEYSKNLDLIFQTRPSTKKVYVMVGASKEEGVLKNHLEEAARGYAGKAEIVFLDGLGYEDMKATVQGAGRDCAIYFVNWFRDAHGKTFIPAEVLRTVCGVAGAPVYAAGDQLFGHGIVGGLLFSFERRGRRIADMALAILSGEAPAQEALTAPLSEYVFDWRALKRWNISEKNLPPGSRVEFREETVWDKYARYMVGAAALVLLEGLLILGLMVNRARRRKAEAELVRINESLEEAVFARTRELETANADLFRAKGLLEETNARLDLASRTDKLTGLYNRRHLEEVAGLEHARCVRTKDWYSIILCDIDYFKQVNDQYGHETGDRLLKLVSGELARAVRPYDTLARWGGEEFLIFLPSAGQGVASSVAERIREGVASQIFFDAEPALRITATLGVATLKHGETVADVIRRADEALYEGKRTGRNRIVTF